MFRISVTTGLSPEEVVKESLKFFGPEGVGLRIADFDSASARFEVVTGFVAIDSSAKEKGASVDLTTEGFDNDVKNFIGRIKHATGKKTKVKAEE
jgi:hypothetical protein